MAALPELELVEFGGVHEGRRKWSYQLSRVVTLAASSSFDAHGTYDGER